MSHTPVLLEETIQYLNLMPGKRVIDATLDGGGHSRAILERFPDIKLLGIELDPVQVSELKQNSPELVERMTIVNDSYANLEQIVREHDFRPDGILMDLGLSSWHYEHSGRGFTFQKDEVLDMRFNPQSGQTAADVVNISSAEELERILALYGEEQFAREISQGISRARKAGPITKTDELVAVIGQAVPEWYKHRKIHYATRTFQALRIAVNGELENVRNGIRAAINVLEPGGRLVVMSFHGLEDKIVREVFKESAAEGKIKWVTKATIKPLWEETKKNPRARSAKMKIAEKIS